MRIVYQSQANVIYFVLLQRHFTRIFYLLKDFLLKNFILINGVDAYEMFIGSR